MNLLLLEEVELRGEGQAEVQGARAEHVQQVLKAQPGHSLWVGIRDGRLGRATVAGYRDGILLLEKVTCAEPPPPRAGVGLLLAMPRPKALRRILTTVAALGLDRLVLVNAAQVDKAYLDSPVLEATSVRRLLDLGLEQAGDTRSPEVRIERRFRPFVEDQLPALVSDAPWRWLLHPRAAALEPGGVSDSASRWIAIGPETGWTNFELELLTAQGFTPVSLGPRMLRVETVVPYALGVLRAAPTQRPK